jgi:U11/U12 small nuclear ribonucleoprotein SNRNP25
MVMMESSTKGEENVGDYVKKARLNSTLAALLHDPILADVPKNPTLSDVDTLISLELGSAMRISVLKLDDTSFGTLSLSLSLSLSELGIFTST